MNATAMIVATVVVVLSMAVGVTWKLNVKAVIAGAVTLSYDPKDGSFAVSADPLALVTKYVTIKVGDQFNFTPDSGNASIVILSGARTTQLQVPANGSWSLRATQVVGPQFQVTYNADDRIYKIDLTRTYVKQLQFLRSNGSKWSDRPAVLNAQTKSAKVDTSKLTTGTFSYCKRRFCALYLHALAALHSDRVLLATDEPVSIPNGTMLSAICKAGGDEVRNDDGVRNADWLYVLFQSHVGYVPAIWIRGYSRAEFRTCGE